MAVQMIAPNTETTGINQGSEMTLDIGSLFSRMNTPGVNQDEANRVPGRRGPATYPEQRQRRRLRTRAGSG